MGPVLETNSQPSREGFAVSKKERALAKLAIQIGSGDTAGRKVLDSATKRERLNPAPSQAALDRIERLEAAGARSQQRLGQFRLR